jgi:pimeloyl-ACP methyl ester carboxylesterase
MVASVAIVGHDIGNMVAFAFAERYPERTTKLVMMDAPVPGVGPWDDILKSPLLWHFRFGGVDMERLVAGRERIYLAASGMTLPRTLQSSTRPRACIMRNSMQSRVICTGGLRNLQRSIRT